MLALEIFMQGTSISSILIRTFFLATAACLALQVTAGDENNLTAQPVRHVEPTVAEA